jgi:hypothetical protein
MTKNLTKVKKQVKTKSSETKINLGGPGESLPTSKS